MRAALFFCFTACSVFMSAVMGACTLPGASDTTSSSGSGGAAAVCTQSDGCSTCTTCAEQGPCASLYAACSSDSDCTYVYTCWFDCTPGDTTCQEACLSDNSAGDESFQELASCIYCDQCSTACTGQCTASE